MARYNLIKIGTIYMTENGLASGKKCKTQVAGLNLLQLSHAGTSRPTASGKPIVQLTQKRNIPISISTQFIDKDVLSDILDVFQASIDLNADFPLVINGDTGDHSLTAVPQFPNYIEFPGEFSGGMIKNVTLRMLTT